MRIEITQYLLTIGVRFSPCGCPVALAVRDAWPTSILKIEVDPFLIKFTSSVGQQWCAQVPEDLSEYITQFDMGQRLEPGSFELEFATQVGDPADARALGEFIDQLPPGSRTGHFVLDRYRQPK